VSPGVGAAHASTVPSPFVLDDYVRFKDDPAGERFHVRGGKRAMVYIDTHDGLGFVAPMSALEKVKADETTKEEHTQPPGGAPVTPPAPAAAASAVVEKKKKEFKVGDLVCLKAGPAAENPCEVVAFISDGSTYRKAWIKSRLGTSRTVNTEQLELVLASSSIRSVEETPAPPAAAPPPPLKRQPSVRRFMKCEECGKRDGTVHEVCGGGWVVCESCRYSSEED
jgi:hypothetical protein